MSFGGESLRVSVVLGETERPGVLGRVVRSRRSSGSRSMAFSALLGRGALIRSPVVFGVGVVGFFVFSSQTRGILF